MNTNDFDIVELCLGDQYHRGDLAPARATWLNGFKHGYKGEAYHSGSFFTTDVNRHINERYKADLELFNVALKAYDDKMAEVMDQPDEAKKLKRPKRPRRSLKGYKGIHWSPFFMLDIDTRRVGPKWDLGVKGGQSKWRQRTDEEKDAWIAENPDYVEDTDAARVEALEVIRCLEKLGVDPEKLVICYSGNKGFHIYVPTAYFAPEPCDNFIYRIRWIVQNVLIPMVDRLKVPYPEDSVDWQVFDRLKVLRAVNSMHQSKRWKVPLAYSTIRSTNFENIRKQADRPNLDYEHPNWRDVAPVEQLVALWKDPACEAFKKPSGTPAQTQSPKKTGEGVQTERRQRREFDLEGRVYFEAGKMLKNSSGPPPNRPLCMVKFGQEDVGSGNRHQACLMLVTTWWKEGYSADQAFLLAKEWLTHQAGTRHDDTYLRSQIESIYNDSYNWGCDHPLAKANCFKECRLFPQAERQRGIELKHFPDLLDVLLEQEKEEIIYFLPYEPLKSGIKLRPKQVLFFVAETAVGKTAFWLDAMRANSQYLTEMEKAGHYVKGGVAQASLEMPGEELVERGAQWILNEDQKFVGTILQEQIEFEDDGGSERYRFLKDQLHEFYGRVWINDDDAVDVKKLKAMILKGKAEHNIGLWVVDYMGRMHARGSNQHERLSTIAREMKTIARSTDVILVVLVQVARATSERGPPGLRSGRGSGEIEESADVLITAYRPDRNESDEDKAQRQAEDVHRPKGYRVNLDVQKARRGGIGLRCELWFEGRSMRFTPLKEKEANDDSAADAYIQSMESVF